MKQILQSLKDGSTTVADVPTPRCGPGQVQIATTVSLVSAGTERMLVDFGRANLLDKARQQPDKVRQVFDKVRTDGLVATLDAVMSKLDQPLALGYCNVGVVRDVGSGVQRLEAGDRVMSNGKHAEIVCVPRNLCAAIPDTVSDEAAAFTVIGAIGLQGIRLVQPTLGECVVVTGLGLIGLLTVQMLRAQGCRVMGIDLDPARLELARRMGAEVVVNAAGGMEDVLAASDDFSRGRGVDAVLITAATSSSEPVHQAAKMCRKRGRIVLVGVSGLELSRADFYEKELSFQVSCSYGPGRYDPSYEEAGFDYPVGFVRWTEQRNFEAVLDLMASGALDVEPLMTHRFPLDRAAEAYVLLASSEPSMGILLEYPRRTDGPVSGSGRDDVVVPLGRESPEPQPTTETAGTTSDRAVQMAFVGAGNYAGRVLIPAFRAAGSGLHTVVSGGGVSAVHYGRKHGFRQAATSLDAVLEDSAIGGVVIATRHDLHATQVLAALHARKHVFCEKPLCLALDELAQIEDAWGTFSERERPLLMVGFNRRFAPQVVRMKELLERSPGPRTLVMTVNAGAIPAEHWTQDPSVGGGRIVGEACHFIDLLRHLVGAPIASWSRSTMRAATDDTVTLNLTFADGSIGAIHYLANGPKAFPKERLEVFAQGRVLQLDNFRRLRGLGWQGFSRMNLWRQDKGQVACARAFVDAVRHGAREAPIPAAELFEVSRVAIELASSPNARG